MTEQVADAPTSPEDAFDAAFDEINREFGDGVDVEEALADVNLEGDNEVDGDADAARAVPAEEGPGQDSQHPMPIRGERPGTDEVLQYLGEEWPEAAEVMKGWQSNMSRQTNEVNDLRSQMLDVMSELQSFRTGNPSEEAETPEEEEQKLYTEDQQQLLAQWAEHNGFVRQSDLQEAAAEQAEEDETQAVLRQGVEQYGPAFGEVAEDGTTTLSEEMRQQLLPIMERIDANGVSALDMVRMAGLFPQEESESARTLQGPESSPAPRSRQALSRANTSRRAGAAAGGDGAVQISFEGDDSEDVFDRAYALAKRARTRR